MGQDGEEVGGRGLEGKGRHGCTSFTKLREAVNVFYFRVNKLECRAVASNIQYTMFHVSRSSLYTDTQSLAALMRFGAVLGSLP